MKQKKAEESEQKFKGIFNTLQDAYFEADINGKFVNINAAAPKMYGFESVEEMLNMPALNLYANEKVRADMISLLSKQGKITDFICEGKRKDGTPFWVSMNVQFKYDIDGKITGTVGVVRDISERKQAEKVLVETSNRLNEVLENAIDASYKRNLHINSYEYLSPVFEKISGYTMVEMNSMSIGEVMKLMHPDDIAEAEKTVKNALSGSGGDSYEVIYRFKHKTDGNYRWILDKFTIMRDNIDNPVAILPNISKPRLHWSKVKSGIADCSKISKRGLLFMRLIPLL
jgi:PAS domain S-box-containing protein